MTYLHLLLGFGILIGAGELLVKGAVSLALRLKISVLVVGMTVVAFGTSAPELVVSLNSALAGHPDVAIGNVVGSNIANLALVLGLTVLIFPIVIGKSTIKFDWPIMMGASLLFYAFIYNGLITQIEGIILFLFLIGFIIFSIRSSRKEQKNTSKELDVDSSKKQLPVALALLFVVLGCLGLVFGVHLFIDKGAIPIAKDFGVDDHTISVTLVAFGTSVPELVTSMVAAFKKETDISIGNLIGSNIFNILAILGITASVVKIPVNEVVINNDIYWMLGISLILFPMMIYKRKLIRTFGAILFASYFTYFYFVLT